MNLKPITTEKAIMMIETNNTITFSVEKIYSKEDIKKEIEEIFKVKIEKVRTHIKRNTKYIYIKLNKENPAIDMATKIGIM
jgi:large subunit ribosomal protein L23